MREELLLRGIRLVLVISILTLIPDAVAQTTFGAPMNYAVGVAPGAVVTGDFNNDGDLDLAVANTGSNNVSILIGNGDGTFRAAVNYAVGPDPVAIAVVDLNGDHNQDLAIAFHGDVSSLQLGGVSLLVGNGDGTFRTISGIASSDYPQGLVAGDFNADGKPDLAIANIDASISVFLGNGDGTFHSAGNYVVTGDPGSIVMADFNEDGKQDLLVITGYVVAVEEYAGKASVLLGNGNGTFQAPLETDLGGAGASASVADFNGDHVLDLAFLIRSNVFTPDGIAVALGKRNGQFAKNSFAGGGIATFVSVDDIDGDGNKDLIAALEFGPSLQLFHGQGDGTFQLAQTVLFNNLNPVSAAIADFNGDQLHDVAVTMGPQNVVSILLNTTTDFRISASAIAPATVSPGQSASSTVTAMAANGFGGSILWSCSVQPTPLLAPQCSISPSSVNPGTPATLTVTTNGPSAAMNHTFPRFDTIVLWLPLVGALLFCIPKVTPSRDQRSATWLVFICLSITLASQVACGGASSNGEASSKGSSGTPAGNYTVTIKGTSGSTQHTTSVGFVVQ